MTSPPQGGGLNGWRPRAAAEACLLLLLLLLVGGCSNAPLPTTPTDQAPPRSAPPSRAAGLAGPRVVVVVEENHSIGQIIGSPQARFLNRLAAKGNLLTSYFAVTHPSLPNYIAMISGDTQGITSDCGGCNIDASNLADQLQAARISWKAYMEDLPAPCSDTHRAGAYAKKHDPFMYFASVRNNRGRCAKVVPLDQLDADLAAGRLPRFVFVTPNLDHDMHGAGEGGNDAALTGAADRWLEGFYAKLAGSSAWRDDTRLVVTWDEGHGAGNGGRTRCCGGLATGGKVATIVAGPHVKPGHDNATYSHYALLRSIETLFHLPYLGHAGDPATPTIPALTGARQP
jgi:phosphatidylinositol-3-phosphatase